MGQYLLGIDQGTSSTRAIIFNATGKPITHAQHEYNQKFPKHGWVEQNPEDIWQTTLATCKQVFTELAIQSEDIAAIGITNQRETTLIWHKETGKPIYNAIGWQDGRMADYCQQQIAAGHEKIVHDKTGLILNPYFSATKIQWLLDNVTDARAQAERGELLFGTVDTFLLWRLTGGRSHKTDATNASRTLLFNIHTQQWDDELLALFNIPRKILPEVQDCSADFGKTQTALFNGEIAITGMIGDQQGALFGQACFESGMVKSTYGTGAFIMCNTGEKAVSSDSGLLTTVAYRLKNKPTYAIEGSIFVAGAGIKWLRDQLKIITSAAQTEQLAIEANNNNKIYFVPTFTGAGAPYWSPNARASISGLTLETGIPEIVRALLEGCCYCTKDVIDTMQQNAQLTLKGIHVDGGMVVNNWLLQFLADILALDIKRPTVIETTALGAIYLAGLHVGVFDSLDHIQSLWQCDRTFSPAMASDDRDRLYQGWQQAIEKVLP
jgi:glycerol kinase